MNLRNYQSARVDVWISLPCSPKDVDATYRKCEDWANDRLQAEASKVKASADKQDSPASY